MRDDTRNWIACVEYDLATAQGLFETGRYVYVIFMCHLAIEKMLKAHVTEVIQAVPAKTHNLMYLVRKAGLEVPPDILDFLGDINNECVPTRYPRDIAKLVSKFDREMAGSYLRSTREAIKWLRHDPNLRG
jgi:HEPN domain-containing protein